jgi:hypothetical protein
MRDDNDLRPEELLVDDLERARRVVERQKEERSREKGKGKAQDSEVEESFDGTG